MYLLIGFYFTNLSDMLFKQIKQEPKLLMYSKYYKYWPCYTAVSIDRGYLAYFDPKRYVRSKANSGNFLFIANIQCTMYRNYNFVFILPKNTFKKHFKSRMLCQNCRNFQYWPHRPICPTATVKDWFEFL